MERPARSSADQARGQRQGGAAAARRRAPAQPSQPRKASRAGLQLRYRGGAGVVLPGLVDVGGGVNVIISLPAMMRPTGRPRAPPRLLHLRSAAMRPCSTVASGGPLPAAAAAVATTSRSLPVVDPSDTAKVFRTRGTTDLLGTASLLQLCSSPAVVSALCRVLVYAAESRSTVLAPLLWVRTPACPQHSCAGISVQSS
jgi:hypothetical protein